MEVPARERETEREREMERGRERERYYIWVDRSFLKQVTSDPGSQRWVGLEEVEVGGGDY